VEKIGQMTQLTTVLKLSNAKLACSKSIFRPDLSAKVAAFGRDFHIGSFLNGEAVLAAQWLRYWPF
jgi:beta-glucosidase